MNSTASRGKARKIPNFTVMGNPIAEVLEAEAKEQFCREQTYFDAIRLLSDNFQKTPLLTTGKVFVNLARKYFQDGRTDKALEVLDGLAFILRQLESNASEFGQTDKEVIHYQCLLDHEYARLGEIRFARERVVNRIKELNDRRQETKVDEACEKCFATLDEIDAIQPESGPAWQRLRPILKKLELSNRALKPLHPRSVSPPRRPADSYLTNWQPLVLMFAMLLCSVARGCLLEGFAHYPLSCQNREVEQAR